MVKDMERDNITVRKIILVIMVNGKMVLEKAKDAYYSKVILLMKVNLKMV
jgi:hypothetical protein